MKTIALTVLFALIPPAVASPVANLQAAPAHPAPGHHPGNHHVRYYVRYVAAHNHHRLAGPFRTRHAAEDYAHTLRDRGFVVEGIEAR